METSTGGWAAFLQNVAGQYVAGDVAKRYAPQPAPTVVNLPAAVEGQNGQPAQRSMLGGVNPVYLAAGAVALVALVLIVKRAR